MPFYFRKSVSAGPFRFNFSKGGVGASVGVRGLRIGTGPRGHYVNVGYGGIYYRSTLGKAGQSAPAVRQPVPSSVPGSPLATTDEVEMIEIESGDVQAMRDEQFADLLDELNQKQKQAKLSFWLTAVAVLAGGVAMFTIGQAGWVVLLAAIPLYFLGMWLDSYRRSSVLFYEMDEKALSSYETMTASFDTMNACHKKWHMAASGDVRDLTTWKRNAGASQLVDKKPTALGYALPSVVKSNVTPPMIAVGRQTIYFFPDVALVEDGGKFGAVGYAKLHTRCQDARFIEEGGVPRDAQVVGHTWKHPNKSGGPDRRFKDNREIPICLYETLHFTSSSGVNEAVQFSKTGVSAAFGQALRSLPAQSISISSRG